MQPSNGERLEQATRLMIGFAEREGGQRYLWTDAFAVCNLLAIARRTGDHRYAGLALGLVELVHETLGRHREDDSTAVQGTFCYSAARAPRPSHLHRPRRHPAIFL